MIDFFLFLWIWIAAIIASFSKRFDVSGVFLWLAGLGLAGVYFLIGGEFLGFLQAFVSTFSAVLFFVFSKMVTPFQEQAISHRKAGPFFGFAFLSGVLWVCFFVFVTQFLEFETVSEKVSQSSQSLDEFGRRLLQLYPEGGIFLVFSFFVFLVGTSFLIGARHFSENGETIKK